MVENYLILNTIVKALLFTGMRSGESLALRWEDIDFLTLHSLRHANATLLLSSGVDLKVVSEHLGHADVAITGNVYVDVLNSVKKRTADLITLKLT